MNVHSKQQFTHVNNFLNKGIDGMIEVTVEISSSQEIEELRYKADLYDDLMIGHDPQ